MAVLQIILATLAACIPTFTAFFVLLGIQKRREAKMSDPKAYEIQRARRIREDVGSLVIGITKIAAGLCAVLPPLALAVAIIDHNISIPEPLALLKWIALYLAGWWVFGWCVRISDAPQNATSEDNAARGSSGSSA